MQKQALSCTLCPKSFSHKQYLWNHFKVHTLERPFNCPKCSLDFKYASGVDLHIKTAHEGIKLVQKKYHKCPNCSFATHSPAKLANHMRKYTDERPFPCLSPGCDYKSRTKQTLAYHVKNLHALDESRQFICTFPSCGYAAKTRAVLGTHVKNLHSDERPFACPFPGCDYKAKWNATLKSHLNQRHTKFKAFVCSICGFETKSKSSLNDHIKRIHSEVKPVKCVISGCLAVLRNLKGMQAHVISQHTEKNIQCKFPDCKTKCSTTQALRRHFMWVHAEPMHVCKVPLCTYRATTLKSLQIHAESHKQNEQIPCPTLGCKYKGANNSALRQHLWKHKRSAVCPVGDCNYLADSAAKLEKHLKFHDDKKRSFKCPICVKRFTLRRYLRLHTVSHTGEKPFECNECEFKSARKTTLDLHLLAKHSMKVQAER